MASDWRAAIAKYDADVISGAIQFDASGYASEFPGKANAERGVFDLLMHHFGYLSNFPYPPITDGVPIREINP